MHIIIIIWTYKLHFYCVIVIVIITDALTSAHSIHLKSAAAVRLL